MLSIILIWLYCILLFLGYGLLIWILVSSKNDLPKEVNSKTVFPLIAVGMVAVNTIGSYLSLFLKTGLWTHLILISILTLFIIIKRQTLFTFENIFIGKLKKSRMLFSFLFIGIVILVSAYITSGLVKNGDTNLYHAQSIHWIESYPAIKGLGNFFIRFAYNSSWFLQNAIFSFSFLGKQSFHVMNGFFSCFFAVFGISEFLSHKKQFSIELFIHLLLIPLAMITLGGELSSPSTDLPAAIAIWLVFIFSYKYIKNGEKKELLLLAIVLISIFAVTIKISTLPILLLPLFFIFHDLLKTNRLHVIKFLLVFALCFTPWIARSIIQSGYFVYPVQIPALSVEWKIPTSLVQSDVDHIRVYGFEKTLDNETVLNRSYLDKMKVWINDRTLNQKIIFLGALISPFITILFILLTKQNDTSSYLSFVFINIIGLLYWLIISPNIRFGYSWLLLSNVTMISYGLFIFSKLIHGKLSRPINNLLFYSLLLFLLTIYIYSVKDIFKTQTEPLSERIWTQMDYDYRPSVQCEVGDTEYLVTCAKIYHECGYHNFPCFPWEPLIGMFDEDHIQKGFFSVYTD